MPEPKSINLVGVCPHCGEGVEMILTKKQVKLIWKGFKMDIQKANLQSDNALRLDYEKVKTKVI